MPTKRFVSIADTTITNSRRTDVSSSGTLANMGAADSGQIFSVWNSSGFNTQSYENDVSRMLLKFDITAITSDAEIPPNAEIRLKLFNVAHAETLPRDFILCVHPITKSWTEGRGLDLDNYRDLGSANWISASDGVRWETTGSDFLSNTVFTQSFTEGYEDLDLDISTLFASWKSGSLANNGIVVKLTSSYEYSTSSFYKKMFSTRGSEYFFNRPCLEVRWDDSKFDDRNNSYASSALAPASDNLNKLFFYNRIRGRLANVPIVEATGNLYVRLFSGSISSPSLPVAIATASWFETGTYTASFSTTYSASYLTDVWYHHDNNTVLFTGTINYNLGRLKEFTTDYCDWNDEFVITMPNLKNVYKSTDKPRLDVFIRKADWQATIYTVANNIQEAEFIRKAYYRVTRPIDGRTVIDFGTGSIEYTKLSYDKDCNYFVFDMSILETGYEYNFDFLFDIDGRRSLQPSKFKFRVN